MQTVGVRELKARLSQVLREVQRGETILVTDRGRVVAELRPPALGTQVRSPLERALATLAAGGALRLAESKANPYQASPLTSPEGTGRSLLAAERDRR